MAQCAARGERVRARARAGGEPIGIRGCAAGESEEGERWRGKEIEKKKEREKGGGKKKGREKKRD